MEVETSTGSMRESGSTPVWGRAFVLCNCNEGFSGQHKERNPQHQSRECHRTTELSFSKVQPLPGWVGKGLWSGTDSKGEVPGPGFSSDLNLLNPS